MQGEAAYVLRDLQDMEATSSSVEARQLTFMKTAAKEEDSSESSAETDEERAEVKAGNSEGSSSSGDEAKDYVVRHDSDAESVDEDEGPLMD